ncbi:MAG: leucine-rich repeat protein [Firmicutes bacterium]|nr:leucine-rich repeat protein [Bacillota bacterium]
MLEKLKKIILCSFLSLSLSAQFITPVFAQDEEEETVQEEGMDEEIVEDVIEEEEIDADPLEEEIEVENVEAYQDFLYTANSWNQVIIQGYTGTNPYVQIPTKIEDKPVTRIAANAFNGNTVIKDLAVSQYVEEISESAFASCSNLENITTLGNNLQTISQNAFYNCTKLESVTIPESVTRIESDAFANDSSLKYVQYNATNARDLSNYKGAFRGCGMNTENGMEIIIGDSVTRIPAGLFNGSSSNKISVISGGKSLKEVGAYAFANNTGLSELKLCDSLQKVCAYAFYNCVDLEKVIFGEGIQTIEGNVFKSCTKLTRLEFISGAPVFGENMFDGQHVNIYYPYIESVTWEPVQSNKYGAYYINWISMMDSNMKHEDSMAANYFQTPNWPNAYSSNAQYEQTYTFTGASSICVEFDSSSQTESNYDVVTFETEYDRRELSGTEFKNVSLVMKGEILTVRFTSDSSVNEKGVRCKIYPMYKRAITLASPNYPNPYPNNSDYVQEAWFDGAFSLNLVMDPASQTESIDTDYVEIYDIHGSLVKKLGGSDMKYETTIMGNYVKVVFKSDGSINDRGYSLKVDPFYTPPSKCDTLAGYSLSLSGDIGVNFYMDLTQQALYDQNTYMEFSIPGKEATRVKLSDAKISGDDMNVYYVFPYHVSVKEMTDTITAKLYYAGSVQQTYTYTVEDYAQYIIKHTNMFSTKTKDIARSMLMYGKMAQIYFDYHTERLPQYDQFFAQPVISSKYDYLQTTNASNIRFEGARLILKQKPGIKLFFSGVNASTTFTVGGKSVNKVKEGSRYYIVISNINQMDEMFTIQANDGYQLKYGIFSYAKKAFSLDAKHQDLKDLMSAMILYNSSFWSVG